MTSPSPEGANTPLPVRVGKDAEFRCLRERLLELGMDDGTLCRELGIQDMSDLGHVNWSERSSVLPTPLRVCIDYFVRGLAEKESTLQEVLGPEALIAARALGLVQPLSRDPDRCFSPAWLYPVDGFLMVSDRHDHPEMEKFVPFDDVVFPAIYVGTLRFLRLLPDVRGGDALDLCGGTGIGAFHLSRTARVAVTADLTPRSAAYATFNARLNGLHAESVCGDLYEPVAGRQFDLICAHPPFVPATGPRMIYRDAGETGEDVTRGVIAGLPRHLRPGGRCVVLCVARDTQDEPIEVRVRSWLGDAAGEFDVVFAQERILSVDEVVSKLQKRELRQNPEAAKDLRDRLVAASTRQFVYGALLLERHKGGNVLPPGRLIMKPDATAADLEPLLRIRRTQIDRRLEQWLPESKPRLASSLELRIRHTVRDGQLLPADFVFVTNSVIPAAFRVDGFLVPLLGRLTGSFTVREVFAYAAEHEELPSGFSIEDYLRAVATMLQEGFLVLDPPPETALDVSGSAGPDS